VTATPEGEFTSGIVATTVFEAVAITEMVLEPRFVT